MLRKQEVDGSYLSIKWAGAASSSPHSSHWSFPASTIIISSGYEQYYRYYLLLLFNHLFFLIIINYNQFYIFLQQQWSSPPDYYQYIIVIFPWKNNPHSLLITISITNLICPWKKIGISSWFLSVLSISSLPKHNYDHSHCHSLFKLESSIWSTFTGINRWRIHRTRKSRPGHSPFLV